MGANENLMSLGGIVAVLLVVALVWWVSWKARTSDREKLERRIEPAVGLETKPEVKAPVSLDVAMAKTRSTFLDRIRGVFSAQSSLDEENMERLEEILYTSDLGPKTVTRLMSGIDERLGSRGKSDFEAVRTALKEETREIFSTIPEQNVFEFWESSGKHPLVLMVVGVNGAGKTTTIGKLARNFSKKNKRVLIAAGDTFRAAAGDQLKIWSERAEVEIFSPAGVSDPSAVAFDACQTAQSKNYDVLIVDTAGRLHTQANLMEELKKMQRVVKKVIPDAPHEVLLVLDANSGQNALLQARNFHQALGVTGVVLTKLDGTAKGGVAVGVVCELQIPIKLIGVGEGIEDLRPFSANEFVDSIL